MKQDESQLHEINPRLNATTGGFAFSAGAICIILLSFVAGLIISAASFGKGSDGYIYVNYIFMQCAILCAVALTLKFRQIAIREIFPVRCKPKYYLIALLLIFGMFFCLSWVNWGVRELLKFCGYQPRESKSYYPTLTGGGIVPALLVIAVLPAVMEECFFRGVLLNSCEQGMGSIRTIFIVGFCFSLFHTSPEQTVYQFLAGCIFAFLAIRSRSILPSVLMHFINNALILIFAACGLYDDSGRLILSQGAEIALAVCGAAALVAGMVLLILDKTPLVSCKKGQVKTFFLYASVGIALLVVLWISALIGVQ